MEQMNALKEVNKMLRKVKSWKKGRRTMVNVESPNSTNFRNIRVEAKLAWGSPDAVKREKTRD
jgi:hypothetical protein